MVTNGMSPWARDGQKQQRRPVGGGHPGGLRCGKPLAGWPSSGGSSGRPSSWGRGLLRSGPAGGGPVEGRASTAFGGVSPTYEPGVVPADLGGCLPVFVMDSMKAALPILGRRLRGFDGATPCSPARRPAALPRCGCCGTSSSPPGRGLYPCGGARATREGHCFRRGGWPALRLEPLLRVPA